ncbi:MAG: M20/M25/M40 family metallo-hydrolase [Clostridia bacterium]
MDIFLYCLLGVFCALVLFMIIRTLLAKAPKIEKGSYQPYGVDADLVARHLSGAVAIPTVTLQDGETDGSVFFEYQAYLEKTYPLFAKTAEKTNINNYSVIYKIEGSDSALLPIGILAHQDVVPAPPEGWEVPPFSGEIKDGYVYGRGSQDMKSQMIVALEGIEMLLKGGFIPKRSIYFCFGHDEELRGTEGATQIVEYLYEKGVRFECVLDEGGTILDGKLLKINNKIALIGTCEKGYADYILEVDKPGGHSSTPTRRTAVGLLAEAIYDIETNQRPTSWAKPTKEMLRALAPYMNPLFKFVFINRDILSPLLKKVLTLVHPMTNSLVRTTLAPTQAKGSGAPNVLPPKATANINCRINPGETAESVREYLQKIVGKKVKVTLDKGYIDPSPISDTKSHAYSVLTKTIAEVFDGYISAPFLFIAATDSKYYYKLTDNVYRFTPFEKTEDDTNRIHALNERQSVDSLASGVEFYIRFYQNTSG